MFQHDGDTGVPWRAPCPGGLRALNATPASPGDELSSEPACTRPPRASPPPPSAVIQFPITPLSPAPLSGRHLLLSSSLLWTRKRQQAALEWNVSNLLLVSDALLTPNNI